MSNASNINVLTMMALILFSVNSAFAQQRLDSPEYKHRAARTAPVTTNCERGTYCNWKPSYGVVTYCGFGADYTCAAYYDSALTSQLTKTEKKAYKLCLERTPHCTFLSDYGKDNKNISWKMPNTNVTRFKRVSQWIALGTIAEEKARREAKDQAARGARAHYETLRKIHKSRVAKLKACIDNRKSKTYCNCIDSNPGKSSFCSCRATGRTKAECNCVNSWGSLPTCKAHERTSKTKGKSEIKVRAQFDRNGKFLNCYASLNPKFLTFKKYSQGSDQFYRVEKTLFIISSSNKKSKFGINLHLGLREPSYFKSLQPIVLRGRMRRALNFKSQTDGTSLLKKYNTLRAQNKNRYSAVHRDPIVKIDTTFPPTSELPALAVATVTGDLKLRLLFSGGSFLLVYHINETNSPIHVGNIQFGPGFAELRSCVADNSNSATLTTSGVGFPGLHRIENRWKSNKAINIETGSLVAGPIHTGASSSQWELIPVTGTKFYQLKNYWKKTILNIETKTGVPKMTAINERGRSTHWELIPIANSGFFQIKNRWMGTYLNVETGAFTASDVPSAFLSAHWSLKKL